MEKRPNRQLLKLFLLGIMLFVLGYPMIQHKFKWTDVPPLSGDVVPLERPVFSKNAWFDGTYQEKRTAYLNENVGFRNVLVRTYNQIYYSAFNSAKANGVVIGKENYLYEQAYINAYYGEDFQGDDYIKVQIKKLAKVSDTLQKMGKHLVVMLAPGKASFFPEYMPNKKKGKTAPKTNYKAYQSQLKSFGVKTIDINQYFRESKGKSKYPLFPKTGIHWSKYGEVFMADSLIAYLNELDGINIPEIKVQRYEKSKIMRSTDDDIEKGMNLWRDIPDNEMGYPIFQVVKEANKKYSKVLTIADSYYWGPFDWGMSRDLLGGGQFWYYNEMIFPESFEKELFVKDLDFRKSLESNDVVLIMVTDANLYKFGFGFVEQAYDAYFGPK
jgi:SGNH hydrolase-like domain, acetyltransferase AlgX